MDDNIAPTESNVAAGNVPAASLAVENQYRAAAYGLIAGLLRTAPDDDLLQRVAQLSPEQQGSDELALAMQMLGLAARTSPADAVKTEFYHLFIGLGRGEMMPYASWYLTGFLMERPLSLLRSDLVRLGFERQASVHEPEDHIAALCEVMLMLITDRRGYEVEFGFFDTHIAPWVDQFFADLSVARSAVFYRNLGRFGAAFFELEQRYFSIELPVNSEREEL